MKTKGNDKNFNACGLRDLRISVHGLTTPAPSTKMGTGALIKRELRGSFVVPIRSGLLRMTGVGRDLTADG